MNLSQQNINLKLDFQRLAAISLESRKLKDWKKKLGKREQRHLESTAWNALLLTLCSPYVTSLKNYSGEAENVSEDNEFKIYNDLLTESYFLKAAGKSKEAKRIESLVEKLKDKQIDSKIIRFFLSMAWSVEYSDSVSCMLSSYHYALPGIAENAEFGGGIFGADKHHNHNLERFFNQEFFVGNHQKGYNIFVDKPGSHFEGKQSHYIWQKNREECLALKTQTLFGALSQSNTSSLEMTLEIPKLHQNSSSQIFPSAKLSEEAFEDEGFVEESNSTTSDVSELANRTLDKVDNLSIWDGDFDLSNIRYTWEQIHGSDVVEDRGFLTENGPIAFDHLNRIRGFEVYLLTNNPMSEVKLLRDEILRRSLNVLLGLSSRMYIFNKNRCSFDVDAKVVTSGLSTESLKSLSKEFASIGSLYRQLNKFIDHHSENLSGFSGGMTLEAFVGSLRTYMNAYKTVVMTIQDHPGLTLIKLLMVFRQTARQLRFLADICLCSVAFGRHRNAPKPKFPMGLKLLSYVHNLCEKNRSTPNYPVLLHIYQCTAAPFLRSVSDWIFRGFCSGLNAEFFVEVNDHYLGYRDKHYWTHGFKEKQNRADLSIFDANLIEQIFACGKTINLLRNTYPEHYLLQNNLDLPTISIKFSIKELESVQEKSKNYMKSVDLAYNAEKKRKQSQLAKDNLIKREAIAAERKIAEKALEKINDLEKEVKLAIQQKKEKDLVFLKNQMLEAIEERKRAKKERMEKDMEFIKMAEKSESDEAERLKKEREELLSYFEELSLLAMKRESKALWVVRRYELRKQRKSFLENEQKELSIQVSELQTLKSREESTNKSTNLQIIEKDSDAVVADRNENAVSGESSPLTDKNEQSSLFGIIKDFEMKSPGSVATAEDNPSNVQNDEVKKDQNLAETLKKENSQETTEHASEKAIALKNAAEGTETKLLLYSSEATESKAISAAQVMSKDERFWNIDQAKSLKKDSTLQSILYPEKYADDVTKPLTSSRGKEPESKMKNLLYHQSTELKEDSEEENISRQLTNAEIWMDINTEPFQDSFDAMNALPNVNLFAELNNTEQLSQNIEEIDAVMQLPIEIILQRSLYIPLQAQVSVVQDAIVKYFINDLQIGVHFCAFRKFLLLEDGEFGHSLCNQIFDKAFTDASPREFCIPTVLNNMISRAIQLSLFADKLEFSRQLTFSLKWIPELLKSTDIAALDFLELRYRVPWPCNIVVTENCVTKYNKVFSFLLRLKKVNWALQGIWSNLKKAGQNSRLSSQLRTLQLFRYEMQHFVNNVERYIVNQIIHISWQEFQHDLETNVHNLDDLHKVHVNYLNKIIFRSLLSKNAAPVFKIISDIFSLILKMHVQLLSSPWQQDDASKMVTHPSFKSMCLTYNAFQEYTGFLFKVVSKLVQRGYQQHLDDFLLQVNFNGYYEHTAQ